jgi:hypothetical protein
VWKRRERESQEGNPESSGSWLRLAQEEIELRREIYESQRDAELDRELEMLARVRVQYPTMPADLLAEFQSRLRAGAFSADAWTDAVAWLEGSSWFKRRP